MTAVGLFPLSLAVLALAAAGLCPSQQQSPPPRSDIPLSVEEVVKLVQNGLSEELIVTKIKKNGKPFDLSPEELVDLRRAGVNDTIIKFLLDPSQPYVPPQPHSVPSPPPPGKQYSDDPHALKVPLEMGLYHFVGDSPFRVDTKMLLGQKHSGGLMKKGNTVGYLIGANSKARIKETAPVFYIRLPENKSIEEVVLVSLEHREDRRELPMGHDPKKSEFRPDAVRQFDALEVGPHLYKIQTTSLFSGEYLFFLVGSADPAAGNYGKGYDFAVDKAEQTRTKDTRRP
jgi:hypothetical protein